MQIEPFQGEPQLLDARLKYILPPVVEAYIESLQVKPTSRPNEHLDFQSAVCIILYTLCKVRGYKAIVGFLNNEPRYLEPILKQLEALANCADTSAEWQVPYILLLWLSHLILTPFDLASISGPIKSLGNIDGLRLLQPLPQLAFSVLSAGLHYLPTPTKAQDAAAMLLVRLVSRPDMQKLQLEDAVVSKALGFLQDSSSDVPMTIFERLGPLRFLAGIANSAELGHVIPSIYRTCEKLSNDGSSPVTSNAIAKKIIVKIFRNVAILSLRSTTAQGPLLSFLETTSVLEDVIDHLLRSLGDRDTPVRYAGAKAISLVIVELEHAMGHEVIQAILDTFKEDMPRRGDALDFRTANALKWHGLTLALAHTLFKRSASPEQLPDIVDALSSALQFEQRTATGSSVGTNVRDAANFGFWSLSRRYTTDELLSADTSAMKILQHTDAQRSVIQILAIQLVLSACLDPAGNVRRGSSAALQELIGRHPNQVHEGIALVQIVDYQAVGLRRRSIVDVANRAAALHQEYWAALLDAPLGWRGLGSPDVLSREAVAASLAKLSASTFNVRGITLNNVLNKLRRHPTSDAEGLHGLVSSLARLLEEANSSVWDDGRMDGQPKATPVAGLWETLHILLTSTKDFSPRILRSELPSASSRLLTALCRYQLLSSFTAAVPDEIPLDGIDTLTDRLLNRHEETIQQTVSSLIQSILLLERKCSVPLRCIGAQTLCKRVAIDASKSTLHGANRAIALGALAPLYGDGLNSEKAVAAINTLGTLIDAMNVDWRIIGIKALQRAVEGDSDNAALDLSVAKTIVYAVHRGMSDYTIDERGDVGSLVRLQSIACTSHIMITTAFKTHAQLLQILHADIYRLSLEKLDRVRLAAAQCRRHHLDFEISTADNAIVPSYQYFNESLKALSENVPVWKHTALLEGCISCGGISAEPLLQASRAALVDLLNHISTQQLTDLMSIFTSILKTLLLENSNMHPALELLAFLLDMQIPQRLAKSSEFKWRNLLSMVQKSHHKSNDIPKIFAAVHVYRGLANVQAIGEEVLKKLLGMLKTNPYPRVRVSVVETLFFVTREPELHGRDWTKPASQHLDIIGLLQDRYVKS